MLKASKYEASHKIRFLRVFKDDDVDRMQMCIRDSNVPVGSLGFGCLHRR